MPFGSGVDLDGIRKEAGNARQPLDDTASEQITHFTSGIIFSFEWAPDRSALLMAKGDESTHVVLISNFR